MIGKLALGLIFWPFLISACAAENPKKICFKDTCVSVEIADNEISRSRGLMFRESLAQDCGMLFIFPSEDIYSFWMKNTKIDLDMIWLDKDLQVVEIKSFVPSCKIPDCPSYTPKVQAKFVLEVNAGFAAIHKIKINNKAYFKNDRF
ncbi:MAG: DUF192 domain-containing protein [Candidatus Omnitrophica bacterium]|nr:DUF192 domain-containing protein [Candidatus Omnitrophota bacterium]